MFVRMGAGTRTRLASSRRRGGRSEQVLHRDGQPQQMPVSPAMAGQHQADGLPRGDRETGAGGIDSVCHFGKAGYQAIDPVVLSFALQIHDPRCDDRYGGHQQRGESLQFMVELLGQGVQGLPRRDIVPGQHRCVLSSSPPRSRSRG